MVGTAVLIVLIFAYFSKVASLKPKSSKVGVRSKCNSGEAAALGGVLHRKCNVYHFTYIINLFISNYVLKERVYTTTYLVFIW